MIDIVIADDHEVVRSGFAMIINTQADMQVIGSAADGAEAYRIVLTRSRRFCCWISRCRQAKAA